MKSIIHARQLSLALLATTAPASAQIAIVPPAPIAAPPLAPTLPVAPPAVVNPQAKALLEKTLERYRNLKSLSVLAEQGGRTQLIEFRAPQSLKVTRLFADGAIRMQQLYGTTESITLQKVNDSYEWKAAPLREPITGREGRASLAAIGAGGPIFASLLAGLDPFGEGTRYAGSSLALGEPNTVAGTTVVSLIVTPPKPERGPETTLTLLIGKDDSLVREIKTDTKLRNGTVSSAVDKFTQIKPDAALNEASFTFTPPNGAVKVENFSPPKVRAAIGQAPLAINTKDIVGKEFSLEQYKGKVVLIDFWATWCGPCIAELPNVKTNYEKYHDQGFDIVGISLDRSPDPLEKYVKDKSLPWRQIFDGFWEGPIATAYNVRLIPNTLLIGKDGKVAAMDVRGKELETAIKAALAQ